MGRMITGDLAQDRQAVEALMRRTFDDDVAPPRDAEGDGSRFALNASHLLRADDPSRHPDLERGLAWLAATGFAAGDGLPDPALPRALRHALLLHVHLGAFLARYESLTQRRWGASEHHALEAVAPVRRIERFSDVAPSSREVDVVLWQSLCVLDHARALGRDIDIEMVDGVVHHALSALPIDTGTATGDQADDGPRELRALHALGNLALHRRNRSWARAMQTLAQHLSEAGTAATSPHRPWAWFAFAWSGQPSTDATAGDGAAPPSPPDPISCVLLADTAHALGSFPTPSAT